jgi:Putative prokaryotic signal transducing protein
LIRARVEPPSSPPTTDDRSGGGGGRDWVELFRAANDIEAALLLGKLGEQEIEGRSVKDRSQPGSWLYGGSNPWAPVLIYVRRHQLVDARILLAEISLAEDDAEVNREEPRRRISRMWLATAIALGLAISALALLQIAEPNRFCQLPVLCENNDAP